MRSTLTLCGLFLAVTTAELPFNATDDEIRAKSASDFQCALPNAIPTSSSGGPLRAIMIGDNEPLSLNVKVDSPGLGNYLIFFPSIFWFAALTGRRVVLGEGVMSEFCSYLGCAANGFKSSVELGLSTNVTWTAVGKFDFLQHFEGNPRLLTLSYIRGATLVPASEWWSYFPPLARCVSRLSRCPVGDVGCAERFAFQRLVAGPLHNLTRREESRMVGMPPELLSKIKSSSHSSFTLADRVSAAFHIRRSHPHFENATAADPDDPSFVQEMQRWVNGSEFAHVAKSLLQQFLVDLPFLAEKRQGRESDAALVYVSGDDNIIKRGLVTFLQHGISLAHSNTTVQVMHFDCPRQQHSKHRLVTIDGVLQKNNLLDIAIDWYMLSLSNHIYAWRVGSGTGSTFVGSASRMSGDLNNTNQIAPLGAGGIYTKKWQLVKNRRGVCCRFEQEWAYRFDASRYGSLKLRDADLDRPDQPAGSPAMRASLIAPLSFQRQSWRVGVNHSDADMVTTGLNRQFFYPRCLLFESCDAHLQKAALDYFAGPGPEPGPAGGAGRNASMSLEQRMQGHPLLGQKLNDSVLFNSLLSLHPTHPRYLSELAEEGHAFRVIYMTQGERRGDLPAWYREQMQDLLVLVYKDAPPLHDRTTFFYPSSAFGTGRLMLYVAARLLEQAQGWAYDYFLFLDDDLGLGSGSVASFEAQLKSWLPAVAGPKNGLVDSHFPNKVQAISWFDHMFIAYHREAVDVLFPWVTELDGLCVWHSQWIQMLEHALFLRNHLLLLPSLRVVDQKHRPYPKSCSFGSVTLKFKAALAPKHHHCIPPHVREYPRYTAFGETRKKDHAYNSFEHVLNSNKTSAQCACWSPKATECCTLDAPRSEVKAACRETVPQVPVQDGWLLNCADERKVYLIQNQTRREFGHGGVFTRMGFDWDAVRKIHPTKCESELYWVPEGETIF